MKILFDHLAFNQKYGGVSKYFVEIIKKLDSHPNVKILLSVKFTNNFFLRSINDKIFSFFNGVNFRGKPKLERLLGDLISLIIIIISRDIKIYHPTHYSNYALLFISRKTKIISTVHDMNNWVIPEYYRKFNLRKIRQARQMKKSNRIIAISYKTKDDILKYYPQYKNKIDVIYHGVDIIKTKDLQIIDSLPNEFILYVGERQTYKNFQNLLEAFVILVNENKMLNLICAGPSFTIEEINLFKQNSVYNNIIHKSPNNHQLAYLYKKARVFVFPSKYEGFGLPCLEAMSQSCVMAVSDNSVFPEICSSSAAYFNPEDITSIYKTIKSTLYNHRVRQALIDNMSKRIKYFSWDLSAKKHLDVYTKTINQNNEIRE